MSTSPQKLGRYEVVEEIGKGAMGVVYLARDPLIGRLVALKTFRVGFQARDEELAQFRSRFVREAQSAGILSHPNIVTIHDVVDEGAGGMCFIAMEYVKGTNLKQLLQKPDTFPVSFIVEVIAQVAEALDYAHSRGVVHRDIKPANILITPDNRVKITDFGIARLESSTLTMEGQLLGTPNYMAPEQIQGKEIDHRADVFSLGVVFYEMLTRKKPFQGENMTAVTHKIVYDAFRPPEEIVTELPKGLSEVLGRCLEKDPNRRYPRASEVARELRAVLQAQETLDDTVATQEVEPIGKPAEDAADNVPTTLVKRPPMPPAVEAAAEPEPVAAPESATGENAPTRLVARPDIEEVKATVVAPRSALPSAKPAPAPASTTAATVLSQRPRPGAVAPAAPAPAPGGKLQGLLAGTRGRIILGAAAAAVIAIAVVAWLLLSGGNSKPAPVAAPLAPIPTPEQQAHVTAAAAIAEARSQLAQGEIQAALQAVARAELAEPGNPETTALREEIESRQQEIQQAERADKVEAALKPARYAYGERRYADAISAGRAVLEIDPDNAEATRIIAQSEASIRQLKQRQQAIEQAQQEPPPPEPATPAVAEPAPRRSGVPANETHLRIDFASASSEGVLTIYADERQVFREPFRFVRKTGFLQRERTSGTMEAVRKLEPGQQTLRIYVAIPGKATRAISLDANLVGGTSPALEIRVDEEGNASASLK